ncbi:MAG: hypothetical protein RJA44_782 [Pseudomonadota bacterium]
MNESPVSVVAAAASEATLPEAVLDALSDPVLLFDAAGVLQRCNQAAWRRWRCMPGLSLGELELMLDAATLQQLRAALADPQAEPVQPMRAGGGRGRLWRCAPQRWALLLPAEPSGSATPGGVQGTRMTDAALRECHGLLWSLPFPATLQNESFRLVDVNAAFAGLLGQTRERLLGRDPLEFQSESSRSARLAEREQLGTADRLVQVQKQIELELCDAQGHLHRLRAARHVWQTQDGRRLLLTLMQDLGDVSPDADAATELLQERDQLRQQLKVLVETAGINLASLPAVPETSEISAEERALRLRRDNVVHASLPDFDRLLRALRQGERGEARYAIQHPSQGLRWLVTRIDPAAGPARVVTLDVTDQQRSQDRAELLLTELATILESSPAGIASMRGYTLMHCNRRFERMLRLPAGAGVGSDVRRLLASRSNGLPDLQELAQAFDTGQIFETELQVTTEDEVPHWYALSVRRTGPAGPAPQAIAVLSEITRLKTQQAELEALAGERARMAHVLGQQADRIRAVLDSVLVGIVTVDRQGCVAWLNRSARRMFGGELGDFLSRPLDSVATEDELHPFRATTQLFDELRDGEAMQFECRVKGRDGRTFWVVGNAVATFGAHAERELTYALMDIEQRRQAEARVTEARESLQRIIEAAPMAISLWDAASLTVRQLNRVAAWLGGVSSTDSSGLTPEQLYPAAIAARMREDMAAALAAPQEVTRREYVHVHDERRQVWEVSYMPMAAPGQSPDQLLLVASDVTAQRAAQRAELEAAIAQRDMLVQEVHHRIKNNLQGVAGLMQQIAARRPEVQPIIAEVVGQVQAIAQVYGLQVGGVGPLRVRNVIEAITQSVQRTFGRSIDFGAEVAGAQEWTLPESEAIPIALTCNELLTNAIKHSPASSVVACRLLMHAEGVRFEIANDGRLAADFSLERRPSTVSGLGLVRALLPRRNATLALVQRGAQVVAQVSLVAPVVQKLATTEPTSATPL